MQITPRRFLVGCTILGILLGVLGFKFVHSPFLVGIIGNITADIFFIGVTAAFFNPLMRLLERGNTVETEQMALEELQLDIYSAFPDITTELNTAMKQVPKDVHDKYLPPGFFEDIISEYKYSLLLLKDYFDFNKMTSEIAQAALEATDICLMRVNHWKNKYSYALTTDTEDNVRKIISLLESAQFWFNADVRDLKALAEGKVPAGIMPCSSTEAAKDLLKCAWLTNSLKNKRKPRK